MKVNFIIYVNNQERATEFYSKLLGTEPCLNVPGMTEIWLNGDTKLGIMPIRGIENLLNGTVVVSENIGNNIQCEIYLSVKEPLVYHSRALMLGATNVSDLELRNWGEEVAYCRDFDGILIAFAKESLG